MSYLILIRHGLSSWNKLGIWTGKTDVGLDQEGQQQSKIMASFIKNLPVDLVYTSTLLRAKQTYQIIKDELKLNLEPIETPTLNERDYGDFTGKNKWEIEKGLGQGTFDQIRRGWDFPIPNGETMEKVYQRVIPYFEQMILPQLKSGKNILIVAHGNSLRALTKYLCQLSIADFCNLEFGIGEVHIYQIDQNGKVIFQEIRNENPHKGKI